MFKNWLYMTTARSGGHTLITQTICVNRKMDRRLGDYPSPDQASIPVFSPSGLRTHSVLSSSLLRSSSSHILLSPPHPSSPSTAMSLLDALESRHPHPLPIYLIFSCEPPPSASLASRLVDDIAPGSLSIVYSADAHSYLAGQGGFDENDAKSKILYMNSTVEGFLRRGLTLELSGQPYSHIYSLWRSGVLPCVTLRLEDLPVEVRSLVEAAEVARRDKARARKSGYMVGAAVKDLDGNLATAGNLERTATSQSLCAETFAILKADGDNGQKMIREVAVVGFPSKGGGGSGGECFTMPCGRCLQVMKESCPVGGEVMVYVMSLVGRKVRLTSLSHLLSMPYVSHKTQVAMQAMREKAGAGNGVAGSNGDVGENGK